MFLTTNKLLERFQDNLKHTDQIDIAVAWATSGTALELLERWEKDHPKLIRAIVGTFGNATEPDALERLAKIGELRLVEGDSTLFHPKIYIFRGKSLIAWVGSANLTEGGFQNNEETVLETKKGQDVVHWFDERWKECNELQPDDINNYHLRWKQKPPPEAFKALIVGSGTVSFVTGELKPVEGRKNMLEAFKVMCDTLKDGARRLPDRTISTPHGSRKQDVYWHTQYRVWCSFRSPESNNNKFWNGFGLDDLQQKNTSPLTPTVEINPPIKVGVGGNYGGALLRDRQGNIYLGHTGSITTISHKGKSKPNFWKKYEKLCGRENIVTVYPPGKSDREVILLGRVDNPDLRQKVFEFVHAIAKIKEGVEGE